MTPTDTDLQPLVAAQYRALADLLAGLPAERWDTPSLCAGWRVREVVAHLTMPARYDQAAFMAELAAADGDFTTVSNRVADRDGALPTETLVADLRDEVMARWTPPGGGYAGALSHVVIHGLDVTVPLGAPRCASDEAVRAVLDAITAGGAHAHFGTDIAARRFEATDLDWSFGSGDGHRAPAGDLILRLTGRSLPGD